MTSTFSAPIYFLACCRTSNNPFCYCIEKPKLLNFYLYPTEYFFKNPTPECKYNHARLDDHNLKTHNICTDGRAWTLDTRQQRQHFVDTVCGRIPHCYEEESTKEKKGEEKKKERPPAAEIKPLVSEGIKKPEERKSGEEKKAKLIKEHEEDLLEGESALLPSRHPDEWPLGDETEQVLPQQTHKVLDVVSSRQETPKASYVELSPQGKRKASDAKKKGKEQGSPLRLSKPSDEDISDEEVEKSPHLGKDTDDECKSTVTIPSVECDVEKMPEKLKPSKQSDSSGEIVPTKKSSEPRESGPSKKFQESKPYKKSTKSDEKFQLEGLSNASVEKISKDKSQGESETSIKSTKSSEIYQPEAIPGAVPSDKTLRKESVPSTKSDKALRKESVPSTKSTKSSEVSQLRELYETPTETVLSKKSLESKESAPVDLSSVDEKSTESKKPVEIEEIFPPRKEIEEEPEDVVVLTDDLVEKLDRNLHNLETTFDKFVKKNRDFIQNLVECLNFEKQKKMSLEDNYNKIKQENEELKTKNDYLKMVNSKQLELFKNELDRGINENKTIYKRKVHLLERQLQSDQNELQMYKETERKYLEVVEQDNKMIEKLNNQIHSLRDKEQQLLRNYMRLLKFLEKVKATLSNDPDKGLSFLRYSDSFTEADSETDSDVKRVLKNALVNGIKSLNVRDMSILHDAIQDLNDDLCHQGESCGKQPPSSVPDFSLSLQRFTYETSQEDISKYMQDYNGSSNLSIYPSRQMPADRAVHFL